VTDLRRGIGLQSKEQYQYRRGDQKFLHDSHPQRESEDLTFSLIEKIHDGSKKPPEKQGPVLFLGEVRRGGRLFQGRKKKSSVGERDVKVKKDLWGKRRQRPKR